MLRGILSNEKANLAGLVVAALVLLAVAVYLAGAEPSRVYQDQPVLTPAEQRRDCTWCHGETDPARKGLIAPASVDLDRFSASVHGQLVCEDCHKGVEWEMDPTPGTPIHPMPADTSDQACRRCHKKEAVVLADSIHGQRSEGPGCNTCHGAHYVLRSTDPDSRTAYRQVSETCGRCHQGPLETYRDSFHGRAVFLGSKAAAQCTSCHGVHDIKEVADPVSTVSRDNIPATCAQCHLVPAENFAERVNHAVVSPLGPGRPLYFTAKFFIWLTILTMTALILHWEGAQFDRYSYKEKFDYWAVFWGMFIMVGSGLIMWFPDIAARVLPGWAIDAGRIAHKGV